jgi:hypothetical protein
MYFPGNSATAIVDDADVARLTSWGWISLADGQEPPATGSSGDPFPQYLTAAEAASDAALRAAFGRVPQSKVAVFADSMGDETGSPGTSLYAGLSTALGVETYDGAYPGFTSTEVAVNQGGLDLFVTFTNGSQSIPANPGQVTVAVNPTGTFTPTTWANYIGTIAGVRGTLNHNGSTNAWVFSRTVAGTQTPVPPETPFVSEYARHDWVQVIWVGRNNNGDTTTILRDVLAMTKALTHDRYLVLPVLNGTNVAAINAALLDRFGPNFHDLRGYLSRRGLALAGITATAGDTTAMNAGDVPPSLMADATHLTAVGKKIVVNRVAELMVAKGWFPSFTRLPLT